MTSNLNKSHGRLRAIAAKKRVHGQFKSPRWKHTICSKEPRSTGECRFWSLFKVYLFTWLRFESFRAPGAYLSLSGGLRNESTFFIHFRLDNNDYYNLLINLKEMENDWRTVRSIEC